MELDRLLVTLSLICACSANGIALAAEPGLATSEMKVHGNDSQVHIGQIAENWNKAEMALLKRQQIAEAVKEGRMGVLEGEFADLVARDYANPGSKLKAIAEWRARKGLRLDTEMACKQAGASVMREERQDEARAMRAQQIKQARDAGRIGPLQGEYMALMYADHANFAERQKAIRDWQKNKGAAFAAEQLQRRAIQQPARDRQMAIAREESMRQLDRAVAEGYMDATQAEAVRILRFADHADVKAKGLAMRQLLNHDRESKVAEEPSSAQNKPD